MFIYLLISLYWSSITSHGWKWGTFYKECRMQTILMQSHDISEICDITWHGKGWVNCAQWPCDWKSNHGQSAYHKCPKSGFQQELLVRNAPDENLWLRKMFNVATSIRVAVPSSTRFRLWHVWFVPCQFCRGFQIQCPGNLGIWLIYGTRNRIPG